MSRASEEVAFHNGRFRGAQEALERMGRESAESDAVAMRADPVIERLRLTIEMLLAHGIDKTQAARTAGLVICATLAAGPPRNPTQIGMDGGGE
jgi:hypothetical protein